MDKSLVSREMSNEQFNPNLVDTQIKIIGDRRPVNQVIKLLAYIRHAIKNNLQTEIKVKIGHNVVNSDFLFDVNNFEIPDLITQKTIEIN
jgi:hypothetical protein